MPAIYHKDNGWQAAPLPMNPSLLWFNPVRIESSAAPAPRHRRDAVVLMCVGQEGKWVAMVPEDARITHNGQRVRGGGLRVLMHGDSLAADAGAPVYFSTEQTPSVEDYAGPPEICARCKTPVKHGDRAVKCPRCGILHHETAEKNCWSYRTECTCCPQPTALETALCWSPEML